jgi:hypothetical protein
MTRFSLMSSLEANEDGVVELARTLSAPEVPEEPVLEIDRNGTPASALRGRTEQKAPCLPMSKTENPAHNQHRSSTYQSFTNNIDMDSNVGVNIGKVDIGKFNFGNQHYHVHNASTIHLSAPTHANQPQPQNRSLFGTLVLQEDHFTGQQSALIRESKMRYRAGRLVGNFGAYIDCPC